MAESIGELYVKLGLKADEFKKTIEKTKKDLDSLKGTTDKSGNQIEKKLAIQLNRASKEASSFSKSLKQTHESTLKSTEGFSILTDKAKSFLGVIGVSVGMREFYDKVVKGNADLELQAKNLGTSTSLLDSMGKSAELAGGSAKEANVALKNLSIIRFNYNQRVPQILPPEDFTNAIIMLGGDLQKVLDKAGNTYEILNYIMDLVKKSDVTRETKINYLEQIFGLPEGLATATIDNLGKITQRTKEAQKAFDEAAEKAREYRIWWTALGQVIDNVWRGAFLSFVHFWQGVNEAVTSFNFLDNLKRGINILIHPEDKKAISDWNKQMSIGAIKPEENKKLFTGAFDPLKNAPDVIKALNTHTPNPEANKNFPISNNKYTPLPEVDRNLRPLSKEQIERKVKLFNQAPMAARFIPFDERLAGHTITSHGRSVAFKLISGSRTPNMDSNSNTKMNSNNFSIGDINIYTTQDLTNPNLVAIDIAQAIRNNFAAQFNSGLS